MRPCTHTPSANICRRHEKPKNSSSPHRRWPWPTGLPNTPTPPRTASTPPRSSPVTSRPTSRTTHGSRLHTSCRASCTILPPTSARTSCERRQEHPALRPARSGPAVAAHRSRPRDRKRPGARSPCAVSSGLRGEGRRGMHRPRGSGPLGIGPIGPAEPFRRRPSGRLRRLVTVPDPSVAARKRQAIPGVRTWRGVRHPPGDLFAHSPHGGAGRPCAACCGTDARDTRGTCRAPRLRYRPDRGDGPRREERADSCDLLECQMPPIEYALHRIKAGMSGFSVRPQQFFCSTADNSPSTNARAVERGAPPGRTGQRPPGDGLVEHGLPARMVYAMANGHQLIFRCLHEPR